jgi:hypothetical protein
LKIEDENLYLADALVNLYNKQQEVDAFTLPFLVGYFFPFSPLLSCFLPSSCYNLFKVCGSLTPRGA